MPDQCERAVYGFKTALPLDWIAWAAMKFGVTGTLAKNSDLTPIFLNGLNRKAGANNFNLTPTYLHLPLVFQSDVEISRVLKASTRAQVVALPS